jgi:hypothetical protein
VQARDCRATPGLHEPGKDLEVISTMFLLSDKGKGTPISNFLYHLLYLRECFATKCESPLELTLFVSVGEICSSQSALQNQIKNKHLNQIRLPRNTDTMSQNETMLKC